MSHYIPRSSLDEDGNPSPETHFWQTQDSGHILIPTTPHHDHTIDPERIKTPGEWAAIYNERDERFAREKLLESPSGDVADEMTLWEE